MSRVTKTKIIIHYFQTNREKTIEKNKSIQKKASDGKTNVEKYGKEKTQSIRNKSKHIWSVTPWIKISSLDKNINTAIGCF